MSAAALPKQCDVLVIGSGFAGSLVAWILARRGQQVVVVDQGRHPRFAIGESSTPLADFLLEAIANEFDLPALKSLSRWGTWQNALPELRAGKKRGFSYFRHVPHAPFAESDKHESSLLVAASSSDALSDTHWMRSDVDAWFARQAISAGVTVVEQCRIHTVQPVSQGWTIVGDRADDPVSIVSRQIIDASGGQSVLGRTLSLQDKADTLQVRTGALFGHFRDVRTMNEVLHETGIDVQQDPFDPDDAAQHHLLQTGWLWMLRFLDGTTSVGLVQNFGQQELATEQARRSYWHRTIADYPTLDRLLNKSRLVDPQVNGTPQLGCIPRISRLWDRAAGENWALLPSTAGVVDPLHSTGIAHSLYGVLRLARLLDMGTAGASERQQYSQDVVSEVHWIDRVVNCCNVSAARNFELFVAACSLYFVAAIHSERQLAELGKLPDGFLLHRSALLQHTAAWFENAITDESQQEESIIRTLRERLHPLNDVGLMDPSLNHRIARSIAPK